jgi:phosphoribosylamine-glycine ligase
MKVLVNGSGGTEPHYLEAKQSPRVTTIYWRHAMPGIAELAELVPIASNNILN